MHVHSWTQIRTGHSWLYGPYKEKIETEVEVDFERWFWRQSSLLLKWVIVEREASSETDNSFLTIDYVMQPYLFLMHKQWPFDGNQFKEPNQNQTKDDQIILIWRRFKLILCHFHFIQCNVISWSHSLLETRRFCLAHKTHLEIIFRIKSSSCPGDNSSQENNEIRKR